MGAAASVYKEDELRFMEMQLRPSPCVSSTTSCSQYNKERNQSLIRDSANILFCRQTTLTSLHSTPMLTMHVRKPPLIFTANFHHCHLQFWLKPSSHPSLVGSKALCLPSIRQSCVSWISKARSTQTEWRRTYSCGIVTHCISSACWCALETHKTSSGGRCAMQLPTRMITKCFCWDTSPRMATNTKGLSLTDQKHYHKPVSICHQCPERLFVMEVIYTSEWQALKN